MIRLPYKSPRCQPPSGTCRFCILPERDRVALETDNFVVLMGLGPIAIGYCLIITKDHYGSYAEIPKRQLGEFKAVVDTVQSTQKTVFGSSVLFEHGRNGGCLPRGRDDDLCYHAHMHLLPASINLATAISDDNYSHEVLKGWNHLSRRVRRNSYLLVQDGDDLRYTIDPPSLPPRYLRTKAAEQVLKDSTLADWQAFPSYDLIREGKAAIQAELHAAWNTRRAVICEPPLFLKLPQWGKTAARASQPR